MSMENLNNFIESKITQNKSEQNNPEIKLINKDGVQGFRVSREIDGLNYEINLFKKGPGIYELCFETKEHGNAIVNNKGLDTFNKVVDVIAETINILHKEKGMNIVKFTGSKSFLTIEQQQKVEQILRNKYKENNDVLNGFSYSNKDRGSIQIDKETATFRSNKNKKSFIDKIKREQIPTKVAKIALKDLFARVVPYREKSLLRYLYQFDDKIVFSLLSYVGDTEIINELSESKGKKDRQNQRIKLYERVLEKRFPNIHTEMKENELYVYLDSLDNPDGSNKTTPEVQPKQ